MPLKDELLLADDPLFATEVNLIILELQMLGEEGLPEYVLIRSTKYCPRPTSCARDSSATTAQRQTGQK